MMRPTSTTIRIDLENDTLIMHGAVDDCPGCVLRGVLNLTLKQPVKTKALVLRFLGKIKISWTQRSYAYDFELPLKGDLPETVRVGQFYLVSYQLKALLRRPHLLPNYACHRFVHLTRHPLPLIHLTPISVVNQWTDKIDYEISLPTKYFHHGEIIPVHILVRALVPGVHVRCMNCTFKEYASCKPINGWFGGRTKSHGRILYYARHNHDSSMDADSIQEPWDLRLMIPISSRVEDTQFDLSNEASKVRHKIKFQLNIINPDGHLSELRAVLPITILAQQSGHLPTYEQSDHSSFPYNPSLMSQLLQQNASSSILPSPPCIRLPTYDEVQCH
ncbi:hypothetical protein DM01DRAFT_1287981 [Hesseltinella vesiculosa]|uniref:Arrestin C-terminal-like domain-containing protein n=1 Tax=Hesseltinella vesiculosa TaxID=101127 RepID=A0A1X2GGJ8_9FUNG|nr:hypothetical protein DM01DRAFT_1287981 [Hesseltinella vesiculosa]